MNLTLPTDSNERKEIPLTSGCLAYFPSALAPINAVFEPEDNVVYALARTLGYLAEFDRGGGAVTKRAALCAVTELCSVALSLSQELHERFGAPKAPGGDHAFALYPAALAGVARVSKAGNDKHNPGEPLHHARGKSTDHADCIVRHLMDVQDLLVAYDRAHPQDEAYVGVPDAILTEASQLCWRALALSQELHERFGAPLAPGARLPDPAPSPYTCKISENACVSAAPTLGFSVSPGVYRSRKGQLWTVAWIKPPSDMVGPYNYPAREVHDCMCWTLEGRYWTDERSSEHDLVERVSDLPSQARVPAPEPYDGYKADLP